MVLRSFVKPAWENYLPRFLAHWYSVLVGESSSETYNVDPYYRSAFDFADSRIVSQMLQRNCGPCAGMASPTWRFWLRAIVCCHRMLLVPRGTVERLRVYVPSLGWFRAEVWRRPCTCSPLVR